ncbi:flavodoxin family protein [Parahaliea mediterranea]|uniref:Flavodoxin n=1 Tax=Parahaliea mediterranea TaxID=651086 RepID=A0A939DIK4_9GAMM|nr:flavodoxin [Parahaliea mediterranea]MBN7798658.1 flavodoxin [Parahaliea mediterranea]
MKTLLIVYHSQSGASAGLARELWRGAREEGSVDVRVMRAWDCGTLDVLEAHGLALVAPENAGALGGGMKDFLDRVFYPAIDRQLVLPYALVISAGNDGRNARAQVQRMVSGIPFTEATPPLICRGEVSEGHRRECRELGQALAAGLEMGIF